MKPALRQAGRAVALLLVSLLALQLYFGLRIAAMAVIDPASTSLQRGEAWRLLTHGRLAWRHEWADAQRIAPTLQRAVIASEDAGFAEHSGVEWEAIEKAWDKNLRAEARAERLNRRLDGAAPGGPARATPPRASPRLVGGSTISQQLAKNLFLSGERNVWRKAQEFAITLMLEGVLGKRRILEIYLNHVEWGEGVFGAQAAARHYFRVEASQLGALQAARLAVMLPAPKRFEQRPGSAYVAGRAATVAARMAAVQLP